MEFSEFDRGVFVVNVLGIVYDTRTKTILIGKRENDPHIKELTWCFPGGRPDYEHSLIDNLKQEIKKKTGVDVFVKKFIFARTMPENRNFLMLYFYCEYAGGQAKPGEKFTEVEWIKPREVGQYFRTSFDPMLMDFLETLK